MAMTVIMGVGSFVVPALVPGWKAQGLKEMPIGWQILVDISDFCKMYWYIVLPLCFVLAIVLSIRAMREHPDVQ